MPVIEPWSRGWLTFDLPIATAVFDDLERRNSVSKPICDEARHAAAPPLGARLPGPNRVGSLALYRPALSNDGDVAVTGMVQFCGPLYGGGYAVVLRRERGRLRVVRILPTRYALGASSSQRLPDVRRV